MVYKPKLSYDPYEIALGIENSRLIEENFKLREELRYYKDRAKSYVDYLSVNDAVTIPMSGIDIPVYRIAVASSGYNPGEYSHHVIGRWEGGPSAEDNFGYSYYVSKQAIYESVDKARLVQMLMEQTANALARRILGEK